MNSMMRLRGRYGDRVLFRLIRKVGHSLKGYKAMRFVFCAIAMLLFVVFVGCFEMNNVTKEDVSDMADCYETTIAVDDRYAIVLDKNCMDSLLLSAAPKIALETEAIVNAEEVGETAVEATETEASPQYPCPIEDRGDWVLLVTLKRNNFNLTAFAIPTKEWVELITQAYLDGKDFLFIIYKPAIPVRPTAFSDATRIFGSSVQSRYYLEAPGLLNNNALIGHQQQFHFVDPDAFWFSHWDRAGRDRTKSGFIAIFETMTDQNTGEIVFAPQFGSTMDGFWVGGAGAPEIKEYYQLDIYVR